MLMVIVLVVIVLYYFFNFIILLFLKLIWVVECVLVGDFDEVMINIECKDEIGCLVVSFECM